MTRSPDGPIRNHPMRKLLICVRHPFDQWNAPTWFSERLRKEFPQIETVHLPDYKRVDEEIVDAEIVVAWSIRPEQIAAAKKIPGSVRLQEKHVWGQQILWDELPRIREVAGATLGMVGLGSIGRAVAKSAKALGMRVIAVREHPEKGSEGADCVLGPAQMEEVFCQADYIVLAAPVTDSTKAIANAERLALMKPDACLINVGRGPLVDEPALAAALREKKIGGAALDVFPKEPLPADSPLWDVPNLLITPHTAALTDKLWERHYSQFSDNLRRYLAGQPLLAVVDKRKGY